MSMSDQPDIVAPVDLSRLPVGGHLRARREQLGWMLTDVAGWLRIRLTYLEALESGQVAKLPGNAYALGFLRAYSGMLGLDAEDMSRRFRNETKDVNRKPELSFPAPVPERGVPAGAIVLLGVVVVIGAYVGWYEFTGRLRHETHTVPPVPAGLLPYAGNTAAGPSPQVVTVMPGPGQTPSEMAPGPAAPATATTPPTQPAANPSKAPSIPTATTTAMTTPAPTPTPTTGTTPSVNPASVAAGTITLNAVGSSWVQVRQSGGKVLYDHVLKAGDSWSVPPDAGDVTLSTGNAGGLNLSADGVTTPVLGRVGSVRRNVSLSVAAIKDGSIVAASPEAAAATPPAAVPAKLPAHRATKPSQTIPEPDTVTERLNQQQLTNTHSH